jgi:hypothetical protein
VNQINRRDLLKSLLGALGVSSAVVLARAVVAGESQASSASGDVTERADRLADDLPASADGREPVAFLNRAFRNGGGFANGGFRNGGFANGGFRNGSFRNW